MKFFKSIPTPSCFSLNWAFLYDAQDTLAPSHLLSSQYSMPHSLLPKNDAPNISCPIQETPSGEALRTDPLISSQEHLCSGTGDTRCAYGHGPCSLLLLESGHFQNHKSESTNLGTFAANRPAKLDIDISSPKQYDSSNCLLNECSFDIRSLNKAKTFIETKVTAMELQGFNL